MKMSKKKVLVVALVICLIAILSVGTLAWFNYTDDITNKFMVATDEDGEPDFSLEIWETENDGDDTVDADANEENPNGDGDPTKTWEGNTYEEILPGSVLDKDPTVENTGVYDQWLRVMVTFDNYDVIKADCEKYNLSTDLRTWLDISDDFTADDAATIETADTVTYVFYYNERLAEGETATLFTEVTIPGEFGIDDMAYDEGTFTVVVKADAVQADNTGDTAQEAFTFVGWEAGTDYGV